MFKEEKQFVLQEKHLFLVDNMMLKLMTNWGKLWMRKRIRIKRIQLQKLFAIHNVLQRRNCLKKSPGSTCKKNPHVIALAKEIKSNSSFFNKDANTTLLNDINATRLHFDSSDSEEDLNSKKKEREMLEGKEIAEISWVPTNTQLPIPWRRKECLHLRSWGSCLSWKNPLFNVVTLSYFLLQNLSPIEMKRKRGKNC